MNGAAGYLHAMSQSLILSIQAGEGRKQRWMDIQDTLRKLRNEPTAQKAHVTGQTNQIDTVPFQQLGDLLSKAARSRPADGSAPQGRPRARARAKPGASGRFEKTNPMSQASLPPRTLAAMASKFEPRPDKRMPRRGRQAVTGTRPSVSPSYAAPHGRSCEKARASFSEFAKRTQISSRAPPEPSPHLG